jgi:hypothetical protein
MSSWLLAVLGLAAATVANVASAEFHTYVIEQLFSDASGNAQFVVMHESQGMGGEYLWAGQQLRSTHAGLTKTYSFPNNLPVGGSCNPYYGCMAAVPASTANSRVLIATQGFADLHVLTPDYVIPNGFLPTDGGTINYAGVDQLTYGALPTDGKTALNRDFAKVQNVAMNFSGESASVTAAAPSGVDLNQHGLTGSWYNPATGGQGFEVEVYPDRSPGTGLAFVSWFTFDSGIGGEDHQRWYTLSGPVVSGQASAALTIYQNTGGNFNAPPATNPQAVGTATLSFSTCTSGQLSYSFSDGTGRAGSIALTRLTQNVTCSTTTLHPTHPDFALSGNWFDPNTSGQGLTIELNPNSATVFAAWYTYAPNGGSAGASGQRWYSAQPTATVAPGARSIPVLIYETTGGMFNAPTVPVPNMVAVGSGTLAFQSCSAATLSYNFTDGSSKGRSGQIALSRVGPVPPGCTPIP